MCDEKIADLILKYIKSGKSVDDILKEDNSWPVYYHLASNRQNVLNWYPFKKDTTILEVNSELGALTPYLCSVAKKVVSIFLSNKCRKVIEERTKKFDNIEFVDNVKKINEKFDYIIAIGTIENLCDYSKLLKPDGKILIAIDNRFGLKYWCGAKDDFTNQTFGSINNAILPSKADLEELFDSINLKSNFYYMFPDYRFLDLVLTDDVLNNKNYSYHPYYSHVTNLLANESRLFGDILRNNEVGFFANSFFVELSLKESNYEIEYAKYNNYRSSQYATVTYKTGDKYHKKSLFADGNKHISNIVEYYSILKANDINCVEVVKDGDECYTNNIGNHYSLMDYLIDLYNGNRIDEFYSEINKYINYIYEHFKIIDDCDKTIFEKYNIEMAAEKRNKLHYVKDGFVDLCFQNILLVDNKYLLIDQEWYLENVPIEYIVYRSIHLLVFNYLNVDNKVEFYSEILRNIDINIRDYLLEFDQLEDAFIGDIVGADNNKCGKYYFLESNMTVDIRNTIDEAIDDYQNIKNENEKMKNRFEQKEEIISHQEAEINKMIDLIHNKDEEYNKLDEYKNNLECENAKLKQELERIYNSKGYKMLQKFYRLKNK